MTSIDRTAYPTLSKTLSEQELSVCYELDDNEERFIRQHARNDRGYLVLAGMLKTRQQLGYFISLEQIPSPIVAYLADQLNVPNDSWTVDEAHIGKTLYRYRRACRKWLGSAAFTADDRQSMVARVHEAAHTMSDPADLINVVVDSLNSANIELPAFSTLDRLVSHERQTVHDELYLKITAALTLDQRQRLDALLQVQEEERITGFAQMKQTPGPATLAHFRTWADRLAKVEGILDPKAFFNGVAYTKIRQFSAEASAYSIGDMRGIRSDAKRYTLLLSLIHQTQSTTRDEVIEMFLRRMRRIQHAAQDSLRDLQEKYREIEEGLIEILGQVLQQTESGKTDEVLGRHVRGIVAAQGGTEMLSAQVNLVSAYHQNNYLPFLWAKHAANRAVIFRVLDLIQIESSNQDKRLLHALEFVCRHRRSRKDHLPPDIDLQFISQRWKSFVRAKDVVAPMFDRRALEVCIFVHVADALQSGDLYVEDSGAYSDYRAQLLPWSECEERLPEYCQALGFPASGKAFVDSLREQLAEVAKEIDASFPDNSEFSIDDDGVPHLKRQKSTPSPEGLEDFKKSIYGRMPERHLLDVLKNVQQWSHYTKHFGPPSSSLTKLSDSASRYLFTVFGYGCNLGASQTASHAPDLINRQTLQRINAQHINATKLEVALNDIIGEYARFELPGFWGKSKVAIADGTQIPLRKNNLLGEQHIRYGGYGGIAYHHISGEYIALFSHFIGCGVWEAVYILDALLKNKSVYQPDTLHADTQGQSEPVFALAHLLGIKLFPRMRNWNDATFYRPENGVKYKHIDSLFTKTADWTLIENHWQDMMQVVLSIQAGKVLPSMLLRKLNSHSRQNKLYRAFREFGRVIRTMFLLRYVSKSELRQTIRAETTKIESYNDFLDWITFGGQVLKSGDPVEQAKQVKYTNLVANSIMLHNVVDLTDVITEMEASDKIAPTKELVAGLSPYIRDHLRRFGRYEVNMDEPPPRLNPRSIPITD